MMRFEPVEIAADDWTRAISALDGLSLVQCWEYGAARADGGAQVERGLFHRDGRVVGAAQVVVRTVPLVGGGLAWVSRGPLFRRDETTAADLAAMLEALRRHYVGVRGCYLRIAAPLAADEPLAAALPHKGFRLTDTPGWASALLDLSRDEATLRRGLRGNWRNHLNKAERVGLTVQSGSDEAGFAACVVEYRAFLANRGFGTGVTPELLLRLQALLPDARKMVFFRGHHEGVSLGSILIACYGDHCECLVNSVGPEGRRHGLGQLLVWRAICAMKARGMAAFDVGGMDPALTPKGIYDFKTGIGGVPYRLANEVEADDDGLRARLVRWRVARARSAG